MNIYLTAEAADLAARLRGAFTCGNEESRYRPQPSTSFNALIADFFRNGDRAALTMPATGPEEIRKGGSYYAMRGIYQTQLESLGREAGYDIPAATEERRYQKVIAVVLEKIIRQYSPLERRQEVREIVKEHIVKDAFMKDRIHVGFDVPDTDWQACCLKARVVTDESLVLTTMDEHIQALCKMGSAELGALFRSHAADIAKIREQIRTSECHFVVLQIGAEAKGNLRAALQGVATNFEPYLVLLLRQRAPRERSR